MAFFKRTGRRPVKTYGLLAKPERGDQLVTLEIQLPDDLEALDERLGDWVDTARPREKFGL